MRRWVYSASWGQIRVWTRGCCPTSMYFLSHRFYFIDHLFIKILHFPNLKLWRLLRSRSFYREQVSCVALDLMLVAPPFLRLSSFYGWPETERALFTEKREKHVATGSACGGSTLSKTGHTGGKFRKFSSPHFVRNSGGLRLTPWNVNKYLCRSAMLHLSGQKWGAASGKNSLWGRDFFWRNSCETWSLVRAEFAEAVAGQTLPRASGPRGIVLIRSSVSCNWKFDRWLAATRFEAKKRPTRTLVAKGPTERRFSISDQQRSEVELAHSVDSSVFQVQSGWAVRCKS